MAVGLISCSQPPRGTTTWHTLPLGGGGYVYGLDIADDGTKVCKTDTYGAYWMPSGGTVWTQVLNIQFSGIDPTAGCWEIRIAPNNSNRFYMIFGSSTNQKVYRTDDRAQTWVDLSFGLTGGDGNGAIKACNQKIAIDPNNSDIVYVGLPLGSTGHSGIWRSINAGANWTQITDVPVPTQNPGCAGLAFIKASGTVVVGGQTRTARIILPSGGAGVWESTDGGATWTQIANPSTPDTVLPAYTTSIANSVIVVLVKDGGTLSGISDSGGPSSPLTWHSRVSNFNQGGGIKFNEYYAVAPLAGDYTITITHQSGGGTSTAAALAFTGVDVSSLPTSAFQGSAQTAGQFNSPPSVTTTGQAAVIAMIQATSPSLDTGYTQITTSPWSEYQIAGAATYQPSAGKTGPSWTNYFGGVLDVLKQGSGMTLAVDGTAVTASSAAATGVVSIWTAGVDSLGTYWCIDNNLHVYRTLVGTGVWDKMDLTTNGLPANYFGSTPGTICVDPRDGAANQGKVTVSGPNKAWWGYQTANGNAAAASVSWVGSTGGGTQHITANSIPWLSVTTGGSAPAVGEMKIDPIDGTYWLAEGYGVLTFPARGATHALDFTFGVYVVYPNYDVTPGIENLVGQDSCAPLNATWPVVAVDDRNVLGPVLPSTYPPVSRPSSQNNMRQLDWSTADPTLIVGISPDGQYSQNNANGLSGWTQDYGATWTVFASQPIHGGQTTGGCIAINGVDNIIMCGGTNTAVPIYTTDRGTNWSSCGNLPSMAYVPENLGYSRSRAIAADRQLALVFYVYANSAGGSNKGLWKTADGGASFTKQSTTTFSGDTQNQFTLRASPLASIASHAWSDLFMCTNPGDGLYISTDQGVTWTKISATNGTSKCFGFGKAKTQGGYPTIFFYGTVNGTFGCWRLEDMQADFTGTWVQIGQGNQSDFPKSCMIDYIQAIDGDMNDPNRLYVMMNGSGGAYGVYNA